MPSLFQNGQTIREKLGEERKMTPNTGKTENCSKPEKT